MFSTGIIYTFCIVSTVGLNHRYEGLIVYSQLTAISYIDSYASNLCSTYISSQLNSSCVISLWEIKLLCSEKQKHTMIALLKWKAVLDQFSYLKTVYILFISLLVFYPCLWNTIRITQNIIKEQWVASLLETFIASHEK